jgi:hypothetical protein
MLRVFIIALACVALCGCTGHLVATKGIDVVGATAGAIVQDADFAKAAAKAMASVSDPTITVDVLYITGVRTEIDFSGVQASADVQGWSDEGGEPRTAEERQKILEAFLRDRSFVAMLQQLAQEAGEAQQHQDGDAGGVD